MLTKLSDQFPSSGRECKFYLKDSISFIGFYDNGGAYNWGSIHSSDGSGHSFVQTGIGIKDFDDIIGWEYK